MGSSQSRNIVASESSDKTIRGKTESKKERRDGAENGKGGDRGSQSVENERRIRNEIVCQNVGDPLLGREVEQIHATGIGKIDGGIGSEHDGTSKRRDERDAFGISKQVRSLSSDPQNLRDGEAFIRT